MKFKMSQSRLVRPAHKALLCLATAALLSSSALAVHVLPPEEVAPKTKAADTSGFCHLCESPELSKVPRCECYAFCCLNGYQYANSNVCIDVFDRNGESNCDDPCVHCASEIGAAEESREACLQTCCEYDYFAESCTSWRYSNTDIFVSGTKLIRASETRSSQATSGSSERKLTNRVAAESNVLQEDEQERLRDEKTARHSMKESDPLPIESKTGREGDCGMTSSCNEYCDTWNTPVRSVCPVPRPGTVPEDATCAGWGCSQTSTGHADDGCYCCCSAYTKAVSHDTCTVAADSGSCILFCAKFRRNLVPLSCLLSGSSETEPKCGGETCAESSVSEGKDGCICCCVE